MKLFQVLYLQERANPEEREHIKNLLIGLGYNDYKKDTPNSNKLFILSDQPVFSVFSNLLNNLNGSVRDPSIVGSSKGGIKYKGFDILVKPSGKQGGKSAGKENEQSLIDSVKKHTEDNNPITVTFISDRETWSVEDVTGIRDTSTNIKSEDGLSQKADVELMTIDDKFIPLSLKMSSAVFYEAAVKTFIHKAIPVLQGLLDDGSVKLIPHPEGPIGNWKIDPAGVAMKATPEQAKRVVFGSDIKKGNGAIIEATFESSDITWDEDNQELTIKVNKILRKLKDIAAYNEEVYFVIINKSRRPDFSKMIYEGLPVKGLELRAAKHKRITKNFVIVENPD